MRRILIISAAIALVASTVLLMPVAIFSGFIPLPSTATALHIYTAIGADAPDKGTAWYSQTGFVDVSAHYRLPAGDSLPQALNDAQPMSDETLKDLRRNAPWWWRPRPDGKSRYFVIDAPEQRSHHTVIYEPERKLLFVYWYTH